MAQDRYWWFPETSSLELARRIQNAGPGHRLEVRIDKKDAMTFRVVRSPLSQGIADAAGVVEPDINESWLCPPVCPG